MSSVAYEIDLNDEDDGYSRPHHKSTEPEKIDAPPAPVPAPAPQYKPLDPPSRSVIASNLEWWTTEEDVRGWAVDAGVEESVKLVLFDEQKVNGQSNGVVYVELDGLKSAKALKQFIEQNDIKTSEGATIDMSFTVPSSQPFRKMRYPQDHGQWDENHSNIAKRPRPHYVS
ncbi:hypothetical protein TRVA0_037S01200 [Trichomonascus vanleenenianus]|uniref:uncharacterized protein n=1 Tax=Trichomonascus vanleenenianus TaxID=2268995 RepID=UPI003ECAB501